MKLLVVLLVSAALALSSAAITQRKPDTTVDIQTTDTDYLDNGTLSRNEYKEIIDNNHEDEDSDEDEDSEDDIDLDMLSDEELESLMEAEDMVFTGFFDVYLGVKELKRRALGAHTGARPKRWVPLAIGAGRLAFSAGRALFSRFASRGITRSAGKITKHYSRPGNYFSGLREFKNLNPTNVQRIGGSKFNGWTGTSGPYRLTIRSGSRGTTGSNGAPTLSISSKGGKLIRKFRFE